MIAIRGAVQIGSDTAAEIGEGVRALCAAIHAENALEVARIVSAIFTVTPDLRADFPARAAREQGWHDVPMICAQEIAVPGAMARVCRVMLHVEGDAPPHHVYLGATRALRPDLAGGRRP